MCTSTEESSSLRAKRFAPCQNKSLHSGYPQGGYEPGLNGLDNLYIPTSNLAICFFVLEDGSPSADTCFDTERSACPQAAAFFSRRTRITPPNYVYTPFVSDLVYLQSP